MSKKTKGRDCPVTGGRLSSAECGAHRHSRYACPAGCPHNPFALANYDHLLELEGQLMPKVMDRLEGEAPDHDGWTREPRGTGRGPSLTALTESILRPFLVLRDADGRSFVDRWERHGFRELNNDERILLRARAHGFLSLFELREVLDHQSVQVVDLLGPPEARLLVIDRSLASRAVRFMGFLGWFHALPHFHRGFSPLLRLPTRPDFTPLEILTETVHHLGGPTDPEPLRRWLPDNLQRLHASIEATAYARGGSPEGSYDASLVPPRLLEPTSTPVVAPSGLPTPLPGESLASRLARLRSEDLRASLDRPLPLLDGQTPRDAARDLLLRPRVLQWCKSHLNDLDQENLSTGRADRIDWLADELQLPELRVPPPPARAPLEDFDEDENDDDNFGALRPAPEPDRPPAPRVTGPPWTTEEAIERIALTAGGWSSLTDATDEIARSGSRLPLLAVELVGDVVTNEPQILLGAIAIQLHFAFVPRGAAAPRFGFDDLIKIMAAHVERFQRCALGSADRGEASDPYDVMTSGCRQPQLLHLLLQNYLEMLERISPDNTVKAETLLIPGLALRTLVDALDDALRI